MIVTVQFKPGPADKAVFAGMAADLREAAATDDDLQFLRVDHRFNQFVAASAGNRHLLRSITPIHALARRFWYTHAAAAASRALLDYVEAFTRAVS